MTIVHHNRILNDGRFTYTYDAEGNRTSKTDNLRGSRVEYEWNHANLLTTVVYKTSNSVVTKSVSYQYDALGRRIGKSVDDAVGSNGTGNGTVDRRESNLYGDAVDQIFATESGSGDVCWALTDHQGTPRDWVTRSASGQPLSPSTPATPPMEPLCRPLTVLVLL